ncbi:MAG: hypothetical protein CL678_11150 [Bdellovibrionaceae bacterium]|nr:hypothetical protein [Pseudobdellovibrionaceae bacterium]|tara:strand:- start:867 stop:1913 length:1047 start_codon:yes stop_codon:yes gene_type:complete
MAWKPEDKEISEEEAIELAIEESKEFWIYSNPLFTAFKNDKEKTYYVTPLHSSFNENGWLIYFVDFFDPRFEQIFKIAKIWEKRYKNFGIKTIFVYQTTYSFFKDKSTIKKWLDEKHFQFPVYLDHDLSGQYAFGLKKTPSLIYYSEEKIQTNFVNFKNSNEFEEQLQNILRSKNPGLSLPLIQSEYDFFEEVFKQDFKKDIKIKCYGSKTNRFFSTQEQKPEHLKNEEFYFSGNWIEGTQGFATNDIDALLSFRGKFKNVFILATHRAPVGESAIISLDLEDGPVFDGYCGSDLTIDENTGRSTVRLKDKLFYHLFTDLNDESCEIKVYFDNAKRAPVVIHRIFFCE